MKSLILLCLLATCPVSAIAQQTASPAGQATKVYVAFRMENWTAKHLHDPTQTQSFLDTLKTLGCEVRTSQHDGHMDVQCRTVFWKSMELKSHEQAHQWVTWLQQTGFETIHGHRVGTHQHASPANGQPLEIVQYRLPDWRSQHIHEAAEVNQLLALYRALGCEVELNKHDGHSDVKYRCPEWMEIEMPNHDAAHKWQDFLKQGGFETKHEH